MALELSYDRAADARLLENAVGRCSAGEQRTATSRAPA